MSKYRMQITVITDQGVRLTNVYVSECGSMKEATAKAARYADYQMDEESAAYVKHISITRMEGEDA